MRNLYKKIKKIFVFISAFLFIYSLFSLPVKAGLIDDIKSKINDTLFRKKAIEEEIKQTEKKLQETAKEKQSLQSELQDLNLAKKNLDSSIKKTEGNIIQTSKTIDELEREIEVKSEEINEDKGALKELIHDIYFSGNDSLLEKVLSKEKISDYLETNQALGDKINLNIQDLKNLRSELEQKKILTEGKKKELTSLKTDLSGQKQAVVQTQSTKDSLLKVTKNQESKYQKLLEEKRVLMEQFAKELFQYEEELEIAIDPSKLPTVKRGIISWPLDKFVITQLFGVTSASARLYKSGTHNGVDFGVPDGTPVKAVLSGTVIGTGNTDVAKGCLSYGKWVAIRHNNGLTSVYGHMSGISAVSGQEVVTGQVVGFSGRTGYATGPHLHLSILASEAVKIGVIPNEKTINCRGVTIPLALGTAAFLDPMLYLPPR